MDNRPLALNPGLESVPNPAGRRVPGGIWVLLAAALLLTIWYLAGDANEPEFQVATNLAMTLTSGLAAALCIRAAARPGSDSRFWHLLGLACLAWFGGQLIWNVVELAAGTPPEFPSLADAGYILFYPICALGLLHLIRRASVHLEIETVLDGLIMSAVAGLLCYELLLVPLGQQQFEDSLDLVAGIFWQGGIVGLLVLGALALIWNAKAPDRWPIAVILAGLFSFAVADVIYGRVALEGSGTVGISFDLGWHLGFILIGIAALLATDSAGAAFHDDPAVGAGWRSAGTLLSILAFGAVAAYATAQPESSPAMAVGIILVAILIAIKLSYAAQQEQRLAGRTRERDRLAAEIAAQEATHVEMALALRTQQSANAELARLNQTKSEFVSVVSHEFRTPLTSVQGFADILRDEELGTTETKEFAAIIGDNARRLSRMIDDMLDLDRLQSAQIESRRHPVDLNAVVGQAVNSFQHLAARHHLSLELEPDLPPLVGDPDQLMQVVTNLLANAIKYDPAAGVVTIRTWHDGRGVHLSVSDQGIGVPPEALETIFDRFVRAAPTGHRFQGTGLGLAITRQLIEQDGGRVWAESDGTSGSTFHVLLPLADNVSAGLLGAENR